MKRISVIIVIVLAITLIGMTTGLSFAWFASEEKMNSTILHQANSPTANVEVINMSQSGKLVPAVPFVDANGLPSYISDPVGFAEYKNTVGLLVADGVMLGEAAKTLEVCGQFKYEGKDDDGLDTGTRTVVVEIETRDNATKELIDNAPFAFDLVATPDENGQSESSIVRSDRDRTHYVSGSTQYTGVHVIEVVPSVLEEDWYWFTITIYFADIDDEIDSSLNGRVFDFTINVIAP